MSFNLVDLVKDQVKGQLIGHMGSLLGDEGGKATSAVDSMIPALLNGMTGTASNEQGADSLFGAINDQDDSLLDNLGSMLGGGQASTVIDNGNSVLSNLFGGGGLGKLAGALSAFSGVSKGGTSSLMGMLAPIILGVLKRKVMGDGLNAGGLASLLGGQSNNIASALPSGLGDQLNASGFLSNITGAGAGLAAGAAGAAGAVAAGASNLASGARDAAGDAVGGVADAAGNARDGVANAAGNLRDGVSDAAASARDGVANAADSARDGVSSAASGAREGAQNAADAVGDGVRKGGSIFRWLLPLIVLGLLAWLAFKFLLGGGADDAAQKAADATGAATEQVTETVDAAKDTATEAAATATDAVKETASAAMDIDPANMGNELTGLFGSATDTLTGITDVDSAKAALPALGELGTKVDSMSGLLDKVPEAARGPLATTASEGLGKLQPLIDKVLALPGVGAILQPVLGPILEKLQEFG